MLNPAGTTPVLVEEGYPPVPGAAVIAEFLDETHGARARRAPAAAARARRAASRCAGSLHWFNEKFFAEVSGPLVLERFYKRHMRSSRAAARPTPTRSVRRGTMSAIIWPISDGWSRTRDWLAGERHELCRSCRGRASVGGGLSGRRAMERRRSREELVRAGEVAPVVPADPGRDAGRRCRRRRPTPTSTSERSRRDRALR